MLDYFTGKAKSPREGFLYFTDDGDLAGLRYDNWKFVFMEQRAAGHAAGSGPSRSTTLRLPKIFNLRTDPYERADITSNTYWDWMFDHAFLLVPAQADRAASSWRPSRSSRPARRRRASAWSR